MSDPSVAHQPPDRGRATAIAIAVAVLLLALLVLSVVIARRGDSGDERTAVTSTTSTAAAPATTIAASTSSSAGTTSTTAIPAPGTVVAASDQKVVVLDSATGRPVRTLFDLGASKPTDVEPPSIGSVSLSADGQTAFFDVLGKDPAMKRVPTRGGAVEDLGTGRAPAPSPDGTVLAYLRTIDDAHDAVVLRANDAAERTVRLDASACGIVAWSPDSKRLTVDLCANAEPTTVAEIDSAAATARAFAPPSGVRWLSPAYRSDGVLTLAEDRSGDSVVVTVVAGRVTGTVLRRDRTTLVCLDWDRGRSLLFCETDGSVWVDSDDGDAHVVGTGYNAAVW